MNSVNLIGNLVRDIELKYSQGGTAYAKTAIALNEKRNGEDITSYIDLTIFGKTAENMQRFFRKGSRVAVSGKLQQDRWETNAGEKRSKVGVVVLGFSFCESKNSGNSSSGYGGNDGYATPPQRPATPPPPPTPPVSDDLPPYDESGFGDEDVPF